MLEVQLSRRKEEKGLELWKLFVQLLLEMRRLVRIGSGKGGFNQLLSESRHC